MIEQHILIADTTAAAIYNVLLDSKKHSALTGDTAKIDAHVGGEISTFGGYATGAITSLEPNKRIQLSWRASDWKEGHYSNVTFELRDTPAGDTEITFTQTDLPDGTEQEFEQGWEDNYWKPMRAYFEL